MELQTHLLISLLNLLQLGAQINIQNLERIEGIDGPSGALDGDVQPYEDDGA